MLDTFREIQDEVKLATNGVVIKTKTFVDYYLPLIQHYIDDREIKKINTYVIGLQGCQGVGKTVLTTLIKFFLRSKGYKVEGFSIDDFYKSNDERLEMTKTYKGNPYYQISRGIPGTHRYTKILDTVKKAKSGKNFDILNFDKSVHEGRGDITENVTSVHEQQDFVILEGWCVNIPYVEIDRFPSIIAQNEYANKIFKEIDSRQEHFKTVMGYIKQYQMIWDLFDNKTYMLGKNIEWIKEWRAEQEERLITNKGCGMTREEIHEFIKPFIPFTYLFYDKIAKSNDEIDCFLTIGREHLPEEIKIPNLIK